MVRPGRERDQTAAVDARRDIARAAQASGHDMRDAADGRIARRAAEGRVVEIQGVDVDREHRDAALFALRDRPIALQQFLEIRQREQPRQAIVAHRDARSVGARRSANPARASGSMRRRSPASR